MCHQIYMAGTPYVCSGVTFYRHKHVIIIHFNLTGNPIDFDFGINLQYHNLTTWIRQNDILLL